MNQSFQYYLSDNREKHLNELIELLKIPSISALSEHKKDVLHTAEWIAESLRAAGLEHVEVMKTSGNPVVYADWLHAEGKPTALIYGHYDVQPVAPIHLWTTPPFEPTIRNEKLYARGSS